MGFLCGASCTDLLASSSSFEEEGRVQTLTIEAVTEQSGQALFHALSRFQPHWTMDEKGRYRATVMLGSDERVLEVLDAIQRISPTGRRAI
jgi:hypothetical protein